MTVCKDCLDKNNCVSQEDCKQERTITITFTQTELSDLISGISYEVDKEKPTSKRTYAILQSKLIRKYMGKEA